jgi:putative endonuclease
VAQGYTAESLAALYLQLIGFEVLARNLRDGPREIDLIVQDDRWLVVVEVRSRGRATFGRPEESVRRQKLRQLLRAGRDFWWRRTDHRRALRYDLIAISIDQDGLSLRHRPHFLNPSSSIEPPSLR